MTKANKDIFTVFFHEKPAMMLIKMKDSKAEMYASSLAKSVDCTYSHIVNILSEMEKAGLVTFNKKGRLKHLTLTKKGHEVAEHIEAIRNSLSK